MTRGDRMNTSVLIGMVIGVIMASAGASFAGFKMLVEKQPVYAEVLDVDVVAYDVSYRPGNDEGKVGMEHEPGDRIPMQTGQLLLSRSGSAAP